MTAPMPRRSPRPLWHLTPQKNWMNDPNGLVWVDGVYHAFYQYNPYGDGWGNMSWGHAVSTDLYVWGEREVAIPCTPGEQVYSGSAVVDTAHTFELKEGREPTVVAAYTAVAPDGLQAQALAYSHDGGDSWSRFDGNPVLDRNSLDFRDPKVFWYDRGPGPARWVMVAVEAVERTIVIYSSPDLVEWHAESTFALATVGPGVWECPDLFPLAVDGDAHNERWVLVLSTNTEDPTDAQGSAMHWLVGDFDGTSFTPDTPAMWQRLDFGRDFYAGVTFSGAPDGRRVMLGWMSNWQYARQVPTTPFRGALSLPRELSLSSSPRGLVLEQVPVGFDSTRWASAASVGGATGSDGSVEVELGVTCALDITVPWVDAGEVHFELWDGEERRLTIVLDAQGQGVTVRREGAGQGLDLPAFESANEMPVQGMDGAIRLQLFVDAHLVELFADGGAAVMSHQAFVGESGWRLRMTGATAEAIELRLLGGEA